MMRRLAIARPGETLKLLCIGAHSDDIEIGAGGTILSLIATGVRLEVHWCVLSAAGPRAAEAEASAAGFVAGAARMELHIKSFADGLFPSESREIKKFFECLKQRIDPDVIVTHKGADAHQDHREVAQLTWNTFRDHTILAYEIPKWDGDLGQPNVYMPIDAAVLERKIALLEQHFGTQRSKDWFDAETFRGLARLRGMECRAPSRYAEAFCARKLTLA